MAHLQRSERPAPALPQTGCADIVVGREDGSLEVWDIDPQGQPQLVVSTQLPESITAVDGGYITNAGSPDIIVHTFTGKVGAQDSDRGGRGRSGMMVGLQGNRAECCPVHGMRDKLCACASLLVSCVLRRSLRLPAILQRW